MGRKDVKRNHLRKKLLKNTALILAVSMIISMAVGYWYFEGVVKEQKIFDERSRLQQVSNQLSFMTKDIEQFAKSILIDEELQRLLGEELPDSEYLFQRRFNKITKRLVFYGNLRTYIVSTILHMEDGTNYSSSYSANDTAYLENKLLKEEIAKYAGNDAYVYSDPYGKDSGDAQICYQVQMLDQYHFGQRKGTLYIEMSLDYFLNQVRTYADADDYVCLLGNDGNILYEQDAEGKLSGGLQEIGRPEEGIYKVTGGYLICDSVDGAGWELCTLITNQYLWKMSRFVLVFFMLSFLLSLILILVFISGLIENSIRPVTELSERMKTIRYGKLENIEIIHTGDEIETLYECFGDMMVQLQKGEEERLQYEKQKREMEYDIMLSQIHPHYLYNVLNTVVYLAAAGRNKDVVKIVRSLSYTLQDTLNIGEENVETTVEKELTLTESYLDIQKYRYPDMFTADIRCENGLEECRVPKTIIQPLVENAILHGILPGERKGCIWVSIYEEKEGLSILVEDDGVGISEENLERLSRGEEILAGKRERKHIGISNVRDRIRYLYGESYGMEITKREGGGTRVFLHLPLTEMLKVEKRGSEEGGRNGA